MSDRHPLGYRKIRLASFAGWRLRLHIWSGPAVDDPHDHRWSFWSLPLWRSFVDVRYDRAAQLSHVAYACRPDRGEGRSYTEAYDDGLEEVARYIRRPLRPWRCRRGEIHGFAPIGEGRHVSLVLTGPERAATSTVWRPQ